MAILYYIAVYIRLEAYKVDINAIAKAFKYNQYNQCFFYCFNTRIANLISINNLSNMFKSNFIILLKDSNIGFNNDYTTKVNKGSKAYNGYIIN